MTLSKFPSSRPLISDRPAPIPTLSSIATQIRSIADLFQQNCATIDQMGQQIQFLETRISTLESASESASAQASKSNYVTIPTPPNPMNNLRPRKVPFLPKLASRLIKLYFIAIFGFGLFLWFHIIFNVSMDTNLIQGIWDVFCRAGLVLLLFFGVVSVQQSVR